MKIFAIRSDLIRKAKNLAYLIYYENAKSFYVEIADDVDEREVPLLLSSYVKRSKETVDAYHSKLWVKQRIVRRTVKIWVKYSKKIILTVMMNLNF